MLSTKVASHGKVLNFTVCNISRQRNRTGVSLDMDDFFRSFFGFNRRNPFGPPPDSRGSADSFFGDDDDEDDSGDHGMRENPFPGEGFSFHSPDGAFTFNFQFDQPDQIFRHFEEMFKNIGLSEFPTLPPVGPGPSGALPAPEPSNPRDEMLKEPGGRPGQGQHRSRAPIFGDQWKMPQWNRQDPQDKTDSDLDEEVKKRGIEPFLSTPKESELQPQRPQTNFSFSSVSVRTVQGPDGSVEEHRTVRDSSGREETTVRRIMGDRSHSVTTKTNKEGNVEKIEDYKNIDEKNLGTFDHAWSHRPSFGRGPPHQILPERQGPVDAQTESIFSKLFGFKFPRFGGS